MKRSRSAQVLACTALLAGACGTSGDLSLGTFPISRSTGVEPSTGGSSMGGADVSGGRSGGGTGATDTGGMSSGGQQMGGSGGGTLPTCETGAPLPQPDRRYDFSGSGTEVVDRQGGEAGTIVGPAVLDGSGSLALEGDSYVNLPNGVLGGGDSISVMLWVTPQAGPAYWRIFDFGISSEGEDSTGYSVGTYYVALTTETGFGPSGLAVLIGRGGPSSEDRALSSIDVVDEPLAVTVVLDGSDDQGRLYVDGSVVSEVPLSGPLSEIDDVNNWLGRSQYSVDPKYRGSYDEVRIYESALSGCEVVALTALGPDDPG